MAQQVRMTKDQILTVLGASLRLNWSPGMTHTQYLEKSVEVMFEIAAEILADKETEC